MKQSFKREFEVKNLRLNHRPVQDFVISPWFPAPMLIIYRAVFLLYSVALVIHELVAANAHGSPFNMALIFHLTAWGYVVMILYFLLSVILTVSSYIKSRSTQEYKPLPQGTEGEGKTKWYYKVLWLLYNISSTIAFVVTLCFWGFIYKKVKGKPISLRNINFHILNSVFMFIEHTLSAMPWRVLHVVYTILFSALYVLVTAVYYGFISKTPIYNIIDYANNPGFAVGWFGGIFAAILLIHMFFWLIHVLRFILVGKWVKLSLVEHGKE